MNAFKLGKRGFSLLELLMAVAILLVVGAGVMAALTHCLLLTEASYNLVVAATDAQLVLEQIKARSYTTVPSYTVPTFTNLVNETVTITPAIGSFNTGAGYNDLQVTVSWRERGANKNVSLSTSISR